MVGKGQSLFAASTSWRRTNPVFGKCEATAILPIRGPKTGSRRQQSLTANRPTPNVQRRTPNPEYRTGNADFISVLWRAWRAQWSQPTRLPLEEATDGIILKIGRQFETLVSRTSRHASIVRTFSPSGRGLAWVEPIIS